MVQCRTEMSPIVTTDWVPGLEGILVASSLTLLLSRVFTHCRDFTAIKSTPCRVYSRLRAQAGCSINVFCVYYRALLRTIDGGSPGARGHTCKYVYTYIHMPPEITYCTIIGLAALGNKLFSIMQTHTGTCCSYVKTISLFFSETRKMVTHYCMYLH